jgi:glyoxylase-like metal-dependent hydrolase (beta-lactamase superfamily II)
MSASAPLLPPEVLVLERGWLSSNNVVLLGAHDAALVDSGYVSHADQTLQLVERAIDGRRLECLVNTHLHSDHCGGNASLQARFPDLRTLIPPGSAEAVRDWDEVALTYVPTGQNCPRFGFDGLLQPGSRVTLAGQSWQVHAAPGHDPHSVVLFEPGERILISADALWENGFGVVFPELEGENAFGEVASTLDLIERLAPRVVIPGHGSVFTDVSLALDRARSRLRAFLADPRRHATHAAKVLLKFKLLELQEVSQADFTGWAEATPYLRMVHERFASGVALTPWICQLLADLSSSGALRAEAGIIRNS